MKFLEENEKEAINILESKINDLRAECKSIPKYREDELAMAEFAISIERYGGEKGLPWYVYPGLSEMKREDQDRYLTDVLRRNYGRYKHKKESKLTTWAKTSDGEKIKEKRTEIYLSYPSLEFWKQPPSIEDYRIVTYWEAHHLSDGDTEIFNEVKKESEVKDYIENRLDWGEQQILWMIDLLEDELVQFKEEKEKRKEKITGKVSGF